MNKDMKRRRKTTNSSRTRTRGHQDQQEKIKQIESLLTISPVNITKLKSFAFTRGGFCTDSIRQKVWPKLLCLNPFTDVFETKYQSYVQDHSSDTQIHLDINRSLNHYYCLNQLTRGQKRKKRRALFQLINGLLNYSSITLSTTLYYYQGFHDICTVFLMVLGEDLALAAMDQLSKSYFREAMRSDLYPMLRICDLLFPLLATQDPELVEFLQHSDLQPSVILPWLLTWFSHQIQYFTQITRLMDVFLSSHPVFALYVSAAIIILHRDVILEQECDMGTVHQFISSLPASSDFQVEQAIERAHELIQTVPVTELLVTKGHHARFRFFPFLHQILSMTTRGISTPSSASASMMFQYPFSFQQETVLSDRILQLQYHRQYHRYESPQRQFTFLLQLMILGLFVTLLCLYVQS